MRKFIVHTRAIPPQKGEAITILEVEGEVITPSEDPSVMWAPYGEFRFRIRKPEFLYEPREIIKSDKTKEKAMVPPVYYSHSVYEGLVLARVAAFNLIVQSFEFAQRKSGVEYGAEQVLEKARQVPEVLL